MSRKLLLITGLVLALGLATLQFLFVSRLNDPATLAMLHELVNESREARDSLILRPGVWKTSWYLAGRTETLDILKGGGQNPLVTVKQLRFDLDLLPSIFIGRVHLQWNAREKQSGSALKGEMDFGLTDFFPHFHQIQSGPLALETLMVLLPERARSSPWMSGLQGRIKFEGKGSWNESRFDIEVSDLRWRMPGTKLPLVNGARSRTQLSLVAGVWSMNPPLAFKDPATGLDFKLDYAESPRLSLSGPPLIIAALAQAQRCPIGPRLELHWTSQGFMCR